MKNEVDHGMKWMKYGVKWSMDEWNEMKYEWMEWNEVWMNGMKWIISEIWVCTYDFVIAAYRKEQIWKAKVS